MCADKEDYSVTSTPDAHAASHELAGSDVLSLAGLTPGVHKATHQAGGADEIDVSGLTGRKDLVDRGDPAANDFAVGDLTTDGNWNILDLSGIVPPGATCIKIFLSIADGTPNINFDMRKNGNSNGINIARSTTQVADVTVNSHEEVFCDTDRKIEYRATSTTWSIIGIRITSWYI